MLQIQRIIVPTDFSEIAKNAYRYALHFANLYEAELLLFHAVRPHIDTVNDFHFLEETRHNAQKRLQEIVQGEAPSATNTETHENNVMTKVEFGFPAEAIAEGATNEGCDLVVMGTKGEHNLAEKIFGSVTTNVIQNSTQPVLVIPESAQFKTIKNIAFATDLSDNEPNLLVDVTGLSSKFQADLHCVHVNIKEGELYSVTDQIFEEFAQIAAPSLLVTFSEVDSYSVREGLNQFITENDIDLLVMYAHHDSLWERLFHRSLTKEMAFSTEVPLLVLRQRNTL